MLRYYKRAATLLRFHSIRWNNKYLVDKRRPSFINGHVLNIFNHRKTFSVGILISSYICTSFRGKVRKKRNKKKKKEIENNRKSLNSFVCLLSSFVAGEVTFNFFHLEQREKYYTSKYNRWQKIFSNRGSKQKQ